MSQQIFRNLPDQDIISLVLLQFNAKSVYDLYLSRNYIEYYNIIERLLEIKNKLQLFYYPNKFQYYFERTNYSFKWCILILRHFLRINGFKLRRLHGKYKDVYIIKDLVIKKPNLIKKLDFSI